MAVAQVALAKVAYDQARVEGIAPLIQETKLQEAISLWNSSLAQLGKNAERASILKNIAIANWRLGALGVESGGTFEYRLCQERRMYHFKEALSSVSLAMASGQGAKPPEWHDAVVALAQASFVSACDSVRSGATLSQKLHLASLIASIPEGVKFECLTELVGLVHSHAIISLGADDFKECYRALRECSRPIDEAESALRSCSSPLVAHLKLQEMAESVYHHTCIAESRMAIAMGDEMVNRALRDSEDLDMDLVWTSIDKFREAELLTRGRDMETEAICIARRAEVWAKVMRNETIARPLLTRAMQLAESLYPRSFHGVVWYERAKQTLQRYQDMSAAADAAAEERQAERDRANKQPILDKLKPQLTLIRKSAEAPGAYKLLTYIYEKHPPRMSAYKPAVDLKKVKEANADTIKKVLLTAQLHYHTDKNTAAIFGQEWSVLCEEISKLINLKYEVLKAGTTAT